MTAYRQLVFRLPAEHEDDFAAWLGLLGCLGCSVEIPAPDAGAGDRIRLTAYFPDAAGNFGRESLDDWDAELESTSHLEDADWLATYRAASVPFDLGASFRIDPREPGDPVDPSLPPRERDPGVRHLLRIPARTAFGTGSHESTRLCVRWLEELARREDLGRQRILDVGTGSGILAFCAEKLGAHRVAAYDVDAAAVVVARENARRNDCRPCLWAGGPGSLGPSVRFDLALVNVLPERILGSFPHIVEHLEAGARVVSSGNLVDRGGELRQRFAELGLETEGEKSDGEWTSFLLRKKA